MKRRKKRPIVKLRKKAFDLWSHKVRDAYDNKCAICGQVEYLNAHHIESRDNPSLRFKVENGIAVCPTHHKFGRDSAHEGPIWFYQWLLMNRPKTIDFILKHRMDETKENPEYLESVIADLEQPLTMEQLDIMGRSQNANTQSAQSGQSPHAEQGVSPSQGQNNQV